MITIEKDNVTIEVPEDEDNKGAYLLAELSKGIFEVSAYLGKDMLDVLSSIKNGIVLFKCIDKEVLEIWERLQNG